MHMCLCKYMEIYDIYMYGFAEIFSSGAKGGIFPLEIILPTHKLGPIDKLAFNQ